MYQYNEFDQKIVRQRAAQFGDQVRRRLSGEVTENEFKPLRLQNGLYMQLHAYMLRVAIPYGLLSSAQLRKLAHIARTYDRDYAHFTTRQNIQYNWPKLQDVPKILEELAEVEMHAIQTSGNCIRNITSDPFAGVARDEIEDPRPYCELLRQWSTFHPEFAYLPRKFKFAVTGAEEDRAAIQVHDIGIRLVRGEDGTVGLAFYVGGGLGRTPFVAPCIQPFVPKAHLLTYSEAILRVYNRLGRRDNMYKARIKILVKSMGAEAFAHAVEEEWQYIKDGPLQLREQDIARVKSYFQEPEYPVFQGTAPTVESLMLSKEKPSDPAFSAWVDNNVVGHRKPGYVAVSLSMKRETLPPGDVTDNHLDALADLADRYSMGEAVVTHRQNVVFPNVQVALLPPLWEELTQLGFATPNLQRLTDVIACPGLDFCNLANARSIPVAMRITERFQDLEKLYELGQVTLNISGCINACGHHHVGNLGVLGIDKLGVEHYQLMLGGSSANDASIGKILGKAFTEHEIADAVEKALLCYIGLRTSPQESFLATYRRVGAQPFKDAVYGDH